MFTPFNDIDLDGLASQKVAVVHPTLPELPQNAKDMLQIMYIRDSRHL